MNRDRLKGFALGAIVTSMALGLTFTASAGRSIKVEDGDIGVKINKANFTIRDTNGVVVKPFVHNGTTYVPMRAFCEAIGLNVEYDSKTNTAVITQEGANTSYVSADTAMQAAFDSAKVNAAAVKELECDLEWDDGRAIYEIEFKSGNKEYDYEVDALTGKVISAGYDKDGREDDGKQSASGHKYITGDAAKQAAFDHAGVKAADATQVKCELDKDDGVYEVEFKSGGVEYEYEINAVTGKVVKADRDMDD